ncbi:hypothetical protein SAMN05877838_3524 [Hoeflea halophila]|uniref:Uncharacterized protein n=1 Tax=Hoeflea halophila TaxID=714899 RepID=A0A286IEU0_9HYPH|nr:hypothetical protein SAMN05877838_3524 [Hoeflea halophila]
MILDCGKFLILIAMTTGLLAAAGPSSARCPDRPPCKGCGCKGGPGYRIIATGKCAGFKQLKTKCGEPPTLRCTFENAPGTGLNRHCALAKPD